MPSGETDAQERMSGQSLSSSTGPRELRQQQQTLGHMDGVNAFGGTQLSTQQVVSKRKVAFLIKTSFYKENTSRGQR